MARHTIQVPVNKSSNNKLENEWIYAEEVGIGDYRNIKRITANATSEKLYCLNMYRTGYTVTRMGVAWDNSQIPENKIIVSARLYLYTILGHSRTIYYKFGDFTEGSDIPSYSPTDGSQEGGAPPGWISIDLGKLKGNSLIVGADLRQIQTGSSYPIIHDFERWEVYSHRNQNNKPYLEIVYDDIPPDKPSSLYPNGTTESTRDVIMFAWLHKTKEYNQQKGFTMQYSIDDGSTWVTISETTHNQFYEMPANILPTTGWVTWRVRTTDENDEVSEYETSSFNLGILPQQAPIPVAPVSQYIEKNNPVSFEWGFIGGNKGDKQSKFDLEYSVDSGLTWTTITRTTSKKEHELPARTFINGNVFWRIRTYSNWDEVSPYSEIKAFTVIGSPSPPLISSATNSGRPIITWQTTEQHIYELQIMHDDNMIYNSGTIPSINNRSFKIPNFLNNGEYVARMRIANEYNLFSGWAEKSFVIAVMKPEKPQITIFNGEYSVTIKTDELTPEAQIYRDGDYIGKAINRTFIDYTGENKKEYQYFVRYTDNDNFNDSDIKLGRCNFTGNTLALSTESANFIKLQVAMDSNPTKSNQFGISGSVQNYDGRIYPVVEFGEFNNVSKTLSFYLESKKEVDRLIEMIEKRQIFLFRDKNGSNIYGTILSLEYTENEIFEGYNIGFTITKTDYKGVAYD